MWQRNHCDNTSYSSSTAIEKKRWNIWGELTLNQTEYVFIECLCIIHTFIPWEGILWRDMHILHSSMTPSYVFLKSFGLVEIISIIDWTLHIFNMVNQWLFFITIPISTLFGKSTKQFMIRIGLMVLLLDVIYNLLVKCDREILSIICCDLINFVDNWLLGNIQWVKLVDAWNTSYLNFILIIFLN
jgi:hypothetical protein